MQPFSWPAGQVAPLVVSVIAAREMFSQPRLPPVWRYDYFNCLKMCVAFDPLRRLGCLYQASWRRWARGILLTTRLSWGLWGTWSIVESALIPQASMKVPASPCLHYRNTMRSTVTALAVGMSLSVQILDWDSLRCWGKPRNGFFQKTGLVFKRQLSWLGERRERVTGTSCCNLLPIVCPLFLTALLPSPPHLCLQLPQARFSN